MKTLQIIKQDQDKTISLVEHETTHTKYIQKELNYYTKFYIRFLIIRMNTILSNILKYRKTLILPRIYHD